MKEPIASRMLRQSRRLRLIAKLLDQDVTPASPTLDVNDVSALSELLAEAADTIDAAIDTTPAPRRRGE